MSAAFPSSPNQRAAKPLASLRRARHLTLLTLALGQAAFATTIALFYGLTLWNGRLIAWNKTLITGYLDGQPLGNAQVRGVVASAMTAKPSVDFCGYWQRVQV